MCEEVAREVCGGDGFCRVIAGVGSGFFFIIYIYPTLSRDFCPKFAV